MRIMRLLVMFDLPTGSKRERKSYALFRKFLINDGYHMDQYSVYSRVLLSRDSAETHLQRLRANLPEAGEVTVIELTEKQYENREVLVDTSPHNDLPDIGPQLTLTFCRFWNQAFVAVAKAVLLDYLRIRILAPFAEGWKVLVVIAGYQVLCF